MWPLKPGKLQATSNVLPAADGMNNRADMSLQFLNGIRVAFTSDPSVYPRFVSIVASYQAQHMNTVEAIQAVFDLLTKSGRQLNVQPAIISQIFEQFNHFLPVGYKMPPVDSVASHSAVTTDVTAAAASAMVESAREVTQVPAKSPAEEEEYEPGSDDSKEKNFLVTFQSTFRDDPTVYTKFLHIMTQYDSIQLGTHELLCAVFIR